MRDDIVESYLDGYLKFLRDKSNEIQISANITKLTLPFLDNLNDCTEIFIIKKDNEYIITDNGETLSNLSFNGIEINSPTRKNIFKNILISYGVILEEGALIVKTSENNLYLKKHMLLQCIIKINDMYILNRTNI